MEKKKNLTEDEKRQSNHNWSEKEKGREEENLGQCLNRRRTDKGIYFTFFPSYSYPIRSEGGDESFVASTPYQQ